MSAHVYRAVTDVLDHALKGEFYWEGLDVAMDYASWTDQLSLMEYAELRSILLERNPYKLVKFLALAQDKYRYEWAALDYPANLGDWVDRQVEAK